MRCCLVLRDMCPCWKEHNTASSHNSCQLTWAESSEDPRVEFVPVSMVFYRNVQFKVFKMNFVLHCVVECVGVATAAGNLCP